ncbi:MAG: hypothetical protein ACLQU2_06780 [Candidatus Binataceae bacterium]
MNPEEHYVRASRLRASKHLPPDFAGLVLRDAKARRQRSQRNRLTVITAALCVALVLAAHWMMTARTDRQNRELWSKAARQITALEETI